MQLTITDPTSQKTYIIDWISVDTPSGNILFQEHHSPTIVTVKANSTIVFQESGGQKSEYSVTHAVFEITRSNAHILNQN